jgi:transcriptional regulator with XRE-family HTH domain
MNPINQRIKQVRTTLKLSQRDFSKQVYVSQTTLGEIETGVRKVNDRIIQLISTEFNVNKDWLKNGKGTMFPDDKPDLRIEHLINIFKQLDKTLQDYLIEQSESLLKLNTENTIKKKK